VEVLGFFFWKKIKNTMTDRIIRQTELSRMLGVTRQTLWEWERKGDLPKRFKLTKNGRTVGWLASDIEKWLKARAGQINVLDFME